MEVKVLRKTEDAEKVMCVAARGDYMSGWNGDTSFKQIMSTVSHSESHLERARENNHYPNETDETEAKMISFIEKQLSRGHYGPAEHPQITFAVKGVPVFTERQLVRHRHLSFDVQSMRYADFSDAPVTVPKSLTDEEHFSRETGLTDIKQDREELKELFEMNAEDAFTFYELLIENGVPKEDARAILPMGTEVNLTMSGNARTFLHLLDMRRKANAQWSIRELSEALLDELFEWMPYTFNYYKDHGPNKLSP